VKGVDKLICKYIWGGGQRNLGSATEDGKKIWLIAHITNASSFMYKQLMDIIDPST